MENQIISFQSKILQHENQNAAYVEFPYSAQQKFGKKGQIKIKAIFDGKAEYRGSLANMGQGVHCLGLTKDIRKKIGKNFGDTVNVELWQDLEERIVEIPEDVQLLLNENPQARELLEKMSYSHRKEYIRWITDAKKPETRENRKIKMIQMILEGKKGI